MRLLWVLFLGAALFGGDEIVLPAGDRLQAQALAYAQAQAAGLDGTYTFRVTGVSALPRSPGELAFEPAHLSRSELTGRFFASFNALSGGRVLGMVRVDLEGKWSGQLLRTRQALARKAVPSEDQLESCTFEGNPPPGALKELKPGFRLRGPVAPGHLLLRSDLEAIPLVNMGETVRLELVDGGLSIFLDTVARSSGAAGDKVRLEMPSSRKMVQAVVTGPGTARLQWPGAK